MFPKRRLLFIALGLLIGLTMLLAACDALPQNENASTDPTATPTATLDPSGFQAVAPRACLVSDWQTIQSERKAVGQTHWQQGSLMAWEPGEEGDLGSINQAKRQSGNQGAGNAGSGNTGLGQEATLVGGIATAVATETPAAGVTSTAAARLATPKAANKGLPTPKSAARITAAPTTEPTLAAQETLLAGGTPMAALTKGSPSAAPTMAASIMATPSAAVAQTAEPATTDSTPAQTDPSGKGSPKSAVGNPRLAYLVPSERTSWFTGDLMIATAPDFSDRKALAPNILAAGDLTWSPTGTWLAFLAFRPNENLYTVMAVHADGSGLVDLFPGDLARTDSRTSQKAVLRWKDESTVQVITSCGEECRNAFDINLGTGLNAEPVLTPTPIDNYHTLTDSLAITRNTIPFNPTEYPKNMLDKDAKNDPLTMKTQPNWSPDETMIDYLDKKGILWLLSTPDKINYPLDIGLRDVIETQWSLDSHYLSVRAEDRIFIFQIPCDKKK